MRKGSGGDVSARRFKLASGEIAAEVSGREDAPLVIGIPGLSINLRCFDVIFGGLDPAEHRRLAFDPRGRGLSEKTPAGTYGWPSHVRDILEMADQLGAQSFDLIGLSMGAWIAMKVAEMAPGRVRRMVLIDAGGVPEETVKAPIYAGIDRLSTIWPSREAFMSLASSFPQYQPWRVWERVFDYELEDVEGGARARTQKDAPWRTRATARPRIRTRVVRRHHAGPAGEGGQADPPGLRVRADNGRLPAVPARSPDRRGGRGRLKPLHRGNASGRGPGDRGVPSVITEEPHAADDYGPPRT